MKLIYLCDVIFLWWSRYEAEYIEIEKNPNGEPRDQNGTQKNKTESHLLVEDQKRVILIELMVMMVVVSDGLRLKVEEAAVRIRT